MDDDLEDQLELDPIERYRLRRSQKAKHSMMSYFGARTMPLKFDEGKEYPSTVIEGQPFPGWPVVLDLPCQCGQMLGTCNFCNPSLTQFPFRRKTMAKGFVSNAAIKAWCKENEYRLSQDALPAINERLMNMLQQAAVKCAEAKRKTIMAVDFEEEEQEATL